MTKKENEKIKIKVEREEMKNRDDAENKGNEPGKERSVKIGK